MVVPVAFIRRIPDDVFPMVVSLDTPDADGTELAPIRILFEPVKSVPPADAPITVLFEPDNNDNAVLDPNAKLKDPEDVTVEPIALKPIAILLLPVKFDNSA